MFYETKDTGILICLVGYYTLNTDIIWQYFEQSMEYWNSK